MKLKLSRRMTDTLGVVALLTLAGASYGLGVHPAQQRAAQAAEAKTALIERTDQLAAMIGETGEARAAVEAGQVKLDAAFPLRDLSRQNERLRELALAAEGKGMKLDELRPGTVTWDRRFGAVPIRLSGSAGYEPFVAFLRTLATDFPDVRVVSFTMGSQAGSTTVMPSFATEIIWFTQPQQAARPAATGSTVKGDTANGVP